MNWNNASTYVGCAFNALSSSKSESFPMIVIRLSAQITVHIAQQWQPTLMKYKN